MNREIKFRAKVLSAICVYGDLINAAEGDNGPALIVKNFKTKDYEIVDKETIGQYVGLEDKNGKKIYEGDIIKISPTNNFDDEDYCIYAVVRYGKYELYDEYSTMGFYLDIIKYGDNEYLYGNNIRHIDRSYNNYDECEVVGNIFDNSEMLEDKNV